MGSAWHAGSRTGEAWAPLSPGVASARTGRGCHARACDHPGRGGGGHRAHRDRARGLRPPARRPALRGRARCDAVLLRAGDGRDPARRRHARAGAARGARAMPHVRCRRRPARPDPAVPLRQRRRGGGRGPGAGRRLGRPGGAGRLRRSREMCGTCGCGEPDVRVDGRHPGGTVPLHPHGHEAHSVEVEIETALLAKNDHLAAHNREWLAGRGIVALNLMSSPGSGKTSLLCRTIPLLARERPVAVIEGDQETRLDADRIRGTGVPVVQINTGAGCHLDADMLARGLAELRPSPGSLVFVENVGNLVCPALFDLGEAARIVVVSVTEGEDKPLKYPYMFSVADLVVINKIDLLPYVDVRLETLAGHCRSLNAHVRVLPLSVTTGEGMGAWRDWLLTCEPVVS